MGSWGTGILADDFACDVYDEYLRRYNEGEEHRAILAALMTEHDDGLTDLDDGPVFWLAVAKAQWECGALGRQVLARVRRIVREGQGLERWEDAGPQLLKKRQAALAKFLETIAQPKAKPRRRHKPRPKRAIYEPGACLAMKLPDGDYGGVLVLAADVEGPSAQGSNLVGLLRYKSSAKPTLAEFERREWLRLTHHNWGGWEAVIWCIRQGHRKVAHLFEPVGNIALRPDDPKTALSVGAWQILITDVVLQYNWEAGDRS